MYKIKLNSDFRDWYDCLFYSKYEPDCDVELIRIANNPRFSIPKSKQFQLLKNDLKLLTSPFGFCKEFASIYPFAQNEKLVVYLDELAHRGEGKVLLKGRLTFPFLLI